MPFHLHHVVRYALAGGFTTVLYVALTLLLSRPLQVPIQIAIALSFATVLGTHFLLQRYFVFRHVHEFHLPAYTQLRRYLIVGAVQYAVTAASLAVLPGWLDLSEQMVYVIVTPVVIVATFLTVRAAVFHGNRSPVDARHTAEGLT